MSDSISHRCQHSNRRSRKRFRRGGMEHPSPITPALVHRYSVGWVSFEHSPYRWQSSERKTQLFSSSSSTFVQQTGGRENNGYIYTVYIYISVHIQTDRIPTGTRTHFTRTHTSSFSIIYNSIAEKSIIHRGPRIWSNIPQPIKECETKNSFNKLLKRHFLTNQEHLS